MSIKSKNHLKFVTIALIVCVSNLFIFAQTNLLGVLNTTDASEIKVNGNSAANGMTIVSGTEIRTGKVGATVRIPQLGDVDICPNSVVKIVFSAGQVNLGLSTGQGKLTATQNNSGTITLPTGEVLKTDPTLSVSTVGPGCLVPTGVPPSNNGSGGLFGLGIGGTIAVLSGIAGATILIVVLANDNDNVSP